jgi:alkylation response protein AidB-like acyl-CoA dehydrogenase
MTVRDDSSALARARALADDVLFPAALATDAADAVPVRLLDAIADAGLYGLVAPREAGGTGADMAEAFAVVETLASGCLTTAFVWAQHNSALRSVIASTNDAMREWVTPLARGERRAGLALGGALSGTPKVTARQTSGGWLFDGSSPFVSGWGLVWALLDARESESLRVERLRLVALNATSTVRADFRGHFVPSERVTLIDRFSRGPTSPATLRGHAAFALGVADRCCRLLGGTPLGDELARTRAQLDRLDPATIEVDRAAAAELAMRCALALLVTTGSRSLLLDEHGQRLAREALFMVVYALRPGSREWLLGRYGELTERGRPPL